MSVITRTDVTAVKLYDNYILAGIGSFINIFDRYSAKLMQKIHALDGQKIYNFVPSNENNILVFGGKQFTVITREIRNGEEIFVKLFEAICCKDWLHSGIWLEDGCISLLTAHNVVQKWDTTTQSVVSEHISKENSILYSGFLLQIINDVLVFSGTVFSEVLIQRCGDDNVLHHLKGHKGVIFSVSCNPEKGVIVTTSDDRSVRIWQLANSSSNVPNTIDYWKNVNITCIHELYGHLARVMRHCIKNDFVVSVGEDSCVCFWGYDGSLLRKVTAHQNACIWSLDTDDRDLVTGGGDAGVMLHPLSMVRHYGTSEVLDTEVANAKNIVFTARRNIVIMTESSELVYLNTAEKSSTTFKLNHESTYRLISISSCKQIVAIVDMLGNFSVYTETCKGAPSIQQLINTKLEIGKILSMEWAGNRHLVFCSDVGAITVLASKGDTTEIIAKFILPPCKERWITSAAIDLSKDMLVVGDRCGSLHVYVIGQKNPTQTFKNVHGRYGATSINIQKHDIVTTGRDATVKYFQVDDDGKVKLMSSQCFDFQWVEGFIDKDKHYICGFRERVFVVYDIRSNTKLFEVNCGGGRRSWDVVRYIEKVNDTYEEFIKFVYLKNTNINTETFQLSKVISRNVVHGTHSKEINCLKTYVSELDSSVTYLISGGEDTLLRISRLKSDKDFRDEVIFKQLSNVRTVKYSVIEDNKLLIVSAGGRAQICIKLLHFSKDKVDTQELCNYLINGTDKERKGNQTWRNSSIDFDPETRIMDLDIIKSDEHNFTIVAGCSDAYLRVFNLEYDGNNATFKLLDEIKHHDTCILKTHSFELNSKIILVTATTRGIVSFWDVRNTSNLELKPFLTESIHKSGINGLGCKVISDKEVLLATGGDDNTIHLNLIEITDLKAAVRLEWSSDRFHCSQVTGVLFIEDLIVTTSIDQRITLLRWRIEDEIMCEFVSQVFSDVADIQSMEVMKYDSNSITVCVYGKGIEVISMPRPSH